MNLVESAVEGARTPVTKCPPCQPSVFCLFQSGSCVGIQLPANRLVPTGLGLFSDKGPTRNPVPIGDVLREVPPPFWPILRPSLGFGEFQKHPARQIPCRPALGSSRVVVQVHAHGVESTHGPRSLDNHWCRHSLGKPDADNASRHAAGNRGGSRRNSRASRRNCAVARAHGPFRRPARRPPRSHHPKPRRLIPIRRAARLRAR